MSHLHHVGLFIDQDTNDLTVGPDNNLRLAMSVEAVGQHVRQRLKTFYGEWFLNTEVGVPWLDRILGRRYDPALAEAVVKAEILNTPGVVEITSFSVSFVDDPRRLQIKDVEILTEYDVEARV